MPVVYEGNSSLYRLDAGSSSACRRVFNKLPVKKIRGECWESTWYWEVWMHATYGSRATPV
jgi:hypothetical protein